MSQNKFSWEEDSSPQINNLKSNKREARAKNSAKHVEQTRGPVRVQKFLSECGVCSRRAAEVLIQEGKIKVNGQIISELGTKVDPMRDRVEVRNKIVRPAHKGVILFHKPKNVISTLEDPQGRPAIKDYLTKHHQSYFPVGRLDFESTGLMILTNDGDLADRLLHPRFGLARIYEAKVSGVVSSKTVDKLARGVFLEDGQAKAKVEVISTAEDSSWLSIQVSEGRNRLIRRMMDKVHHPVNKLQRVIHGPFKLGRLKPGQMRKLTEKEYAYYRDRIMNYVPGMVSGKQAQVEAKNTEKYSEPEDDQYDLPEDD